MGELRFVLAEGESSPTSGLAPAITSVPGVRGVEVHPSTREVWVRGEALDVSAIQAAIKSAGYELDPSYPQAVGQPQ